MKRIYYAQRAVMKVHAGIVKNDRSRSRGGHSPYLELSGLCRAQRTLIWLAPGNGSDTLLHLALVRVFPILVVLPAVIPCRFFLVQLI